MSAGAASDAAAGAELRVVVLSVGDEILGGDILDTNAHGIVKRVAARGLRCVGTACVGDTLAAVERAVRRALGDAELVLVTGGLGPTRDDLTRDGVAAALGLPLEERPELLAPSQGGNARLTEGARRQALLPRGAKLLPNPRGTAAGFAVEQGGRRVACFPGPPAELWPMLDAWLDRALAPADGAAPRAGLLPELRLRCCGVSESTAGELLEDLMDTSHAGCRVGITVSRGLLTVSVRGSDAAAMTAARDTARERLGAAVYGEGDALLPEVVVDRLAARGARVATAESCTGGLLAGALTDVPGSSAVFEQGFVTYSNAAKVEHLGVPALLIESQGAVSEAVAHAMAAGVRARSGADYGLSITGVAGPGGGTPDKPVGTVCFGLATPTEVRTRRVSWGGDRTTLRLRSVHMALDLLRRELQGVADDAARP